MSIPLTVIDLLQKEQSLASIARIRGNMRSSASKRRENKVITGECLMELWQHYDEGRMDISGLASSIEVWQLHSVGPPIHMDIPASFKADGLRYFHRPLHNRLFSFFIIICTYIY